MALSCSNPKSDNGPITINIYYTGENGSARAFAEEMTASGVVAQIRAEEGNLAYDYFFPADDPETVLLIDSWQSQKSLDIHHASPMMEKIATLRDKYNLTMRVERFTAAEANEADSKYIRKTDAQHAPISREAFERITPYPIGEPNTGYAQYFVGNSYLAPMDAANGGPINVSFEPGCRNNWHIHHGAVQVLICVAGRGWYQEWGKDAVELKPGVVVAIPEGVKHWHGATADSWMQHLTYETKVEAEHSNEWLEPVNADEYNKLK